VEALFHAWLLTLPEIEFVGHTHAPAINSILCSPRAREFAERRLFPEEIVCCDEASVLVPYTDPGLRLARAIRVRTERFIRAHGHPPRLVLLQNHGVIALGRTPDAVLAAMRIAEKTARIWLGAAALGGPVFLKRADVRRIAGRPDEKQRRQMLSL
jgi:rhamnose utilization protein RhaD (predicted bifunctional aldolase and dehydrogenase)